MGTIFERTRTPLTIWFAAAWYLTSQKNGTSALFLQRVLSLGSYQTAWAMLHRYRTAMVRPDREKLSGNVEVDETFVGGTKPGKRGRGAEGKAIVAIAVEITPEGFGRCRVEVIPNATSAALHDFLERNVEPGSVLLTDGWKSYPGAIADIWGHKPVNVKGSGEPSHIPLPGVHRIASLLKRWLLGTLQGAVEVDHLQAYLDEFCFRFNRRISNKRGLLFYRLLELSVVAVPVTSWSLVVNSTSKTITPTPPATRGNPRSLVITGVSRPWHKTVTVERRSGLVLDVGTRSEL